MLQDNFARKFNYVRISLTERCNFKCQYCLPNGYKSCGNENYLNQNELFNLITVLVELGVWKIRFTGGEPTLRRDLSNILHMVKGFTSVKVIGLTTNAYHLSANLDSYIQNGLTNINISMDSLNPERFHSITQVNRLTEIQKSIDYALQTELQSIKINSVLTKDTLSEIDDFFAYVKIRNISVRFIELMQTGDNLKYFKSNYVSASILQQLLIERGWQKQPRQDAAGPAFEYYHKDYIGKIGVIAPYGKDFCNNCNRLRFTSDGSLRLCLFGEQNYSLRHLMQSSEQREELKNTILQLIIKKPLAHKLSEFKTGNILNLSNVGG